MKPLRTFPAVLSFMALTTVAAHSQDAPAVGSTFSPERMKTEEGCIGYLDTVAALETGGWNSAGWVWHNMRKEVPRAVVILGPDDKVLAIGRTGANRPDVPTANADVTSQQSGWSAEAEGEAPKLEELTVYALIDDQTICRPPLKNAAQVRENG